MRTQSANDNTQVVLDGSQMTFVYMAVFFVSIGWMPFLVTTLDKC